MLNCTPVSTAKKTAGLAVTYRAGGGDMFATCPDRCALKPVETGTVEVDRKYERAVRRAVPRKGISFLYTHFAPETWAEQNTGAAKQTVFNYSADSLADAAQYIKRGVASVAVVPHDYWNGRASAKVTESDGVRMVRCLDELTGIGCAGCGNGEPLCARPDRDYGILFTSHGAAKRKAGDNATAGGCYAAGGHVAIHWRNLSERGEAVESDSEHVLRFAAGLRRGSILRHHIAGDLGRVPAAIK
jgi:hypothetical protein